MSKKITTIQELAWLAQTLEKDEFLMMMKDLENYLESIRIFNKHMYIFNECVFEWINDGKNDISIKYNTQ
jgi:hypothetical protein